MSARVDSLRRPRIRAGALVIALAAAVSAGCYSASDDADPTAGGTLPKPVETGADLTIAPVSFNASNAPLGRVVGLVELDADIVVFSDLGALVVSGGALAATDDSVKDWKRAAAVPAPDGSGTWAVGVTGDGRVMRLRARKMLEDVTSRFDLPSGRVRDVVAAGADGVAFGTDTGLVVVKGGKADTFDAGAWVSLVATDKRVAGIVGDEVRVLDFAAGSVATEQVQGARALAFDASGKLVVLTDHAIWGEGNAKPTDAAGGALAPAGLFGRIYSRDDVVMRGLAGGSSRVWFGMGDGLAALEGSTVRLAKGGPALAPDAVLAVGKTGDLWTLGPSVMRFGVTTSGDEALWTATVMPIYARICKSCHAPGASSGIDLSTYAAWDQRRAAIRDRVVVKRNMPVGAPLEGADLDAVDKWSAGK